MERRLFETGPAGRKYAFGLIVGCLIWSGKGFSCNFLFSANCANDLGKLKLLEFSLESPGYGESRFLALRYDRRVDGEIEVRGNALQATARVVAVDKAPRTQEEANLSRMEGIEREIKDKRPLGVVMSRSRKLVDPHVKRKKGTVDFCMAGQKIHLDQHGVTLFK